MAVDRPESERLKIRRIQRPCLLSVRSMAKHKAAWHAILPGGMSPAAFSLDELRSAKRAHGFLTEEVHRSRPSLLACTDEALWMGALCRM